MKFESRRLEVKVFISCIFLLIVRKIHELGLVSGKSEPNGWTLIPSRDRNFSLRDI
jgi:hypothetical protein